MWVKVKTLPNQEYQIVARPALAHPVFNLD